MRERTKDDLGFYSLMALAILCLGITLTGIIVTILNFLAMSGFFIVDVIK